MRLYAILVLAIAACSPGAAVGSPDTVKAAHRHPLIGDTIGLDHVLLWAGDQVAAEAQLRRLGFVLSSKAGSYGAGISNKLIRFENHSFHRVSVARGSREG